MNCLECREQLGALLRDGCRRESVEPHLTRCPACREHASSLRAVAHALDGWTLPSSASTEVSRAALVEALQRERVAAELGRTRSAMPARWSAARLNPSLLALPAAGALCWGFACAPEWLRLLLVAWFGVAALLVSMVLIRHGEACRSGRELR